MSSNDQFEKELHSVSGDQTYSKSRQLFLFVLKILDRILASRSEKETMFGILFSAETTSRLPVSVSGALDRVLSE